MSDFFYANPENWKEIQSGYIFEALVPYVAERPAYFFMSNSKERNTGSTVYSMGDFKTVAEQKIVLPLKRRKVVVLGENSVLQDQAWTDITIAKIYSIKLDDKDKPWYQLLIADKHPFFIHLDESITGREGFIDVSTLTTIGKTMLLAKKTLVPIERMNLTSKRITEYIGLGFMDHENEEEVMESN